MAIRKIATLGHPVLRSKARTLSKEELAAPDTQKLIDDLVETMLDANGAGLAAPQIYEPLMICALHVKDNPRYPYKPNIPLTVLVNPEITWLSEETFLNYEGCLSVPNLRGRVRRSAHVRVTAWDRHGQPWERVVKGISAGTFQHEVDHLDARIFADRVEDPSSFSTWDNFERHHRDAFITYVKEIVAKYGE